MNYYNRNNELKYLAVFVNVVDGLFYQWTLLRIEKWLKFI